MTAPAPVPALVEAVTEATAEAIELLRAQHPEDFCVYALVTSGEGFRPYLTATVRGEAQWDLADSPYAIVEDEILARAEPAFMARGDLYDMTDDAAEEEFSRRMASMEEALRRLDNQGLFGRGEERARVLLLVVTMPPDPSEAEIGRRLNPPGPLLDAWLREAAEGA